MAGIVTQAFVQQGVDLPFGYVCFSREVFVAHLYRYTFMMPLLLEIQYETVEMRSHGTGLAPTECATVENTHGRAAQQERDRGDGEGREKGSVVSLVFALVVSLCAATVAALFVIMWRDGDPVAAAALALALLPVLVLAIVAWRAVL